MCGCWHYLIKLNLLIPSLGYVPQLHILHRVKKILPVKNQREDVACLPDAFKQTCAVNLVL